jgi:serine/threonine-protein kinase
VPQSQRIIAGRYELGKLIAKGGMATVYQAHDSVTGNTVALKVLSDELSGNQKFTERFKQEARAASSMNHPNIVKVLDAGDDEYTDENGNKHSRSFIVMDYVDGIELSKLVARGPLKVTEAVRVAAELLAAVEYAHTVGIVHRDIKPANIMVERNGTVKVVDFGIARAVSDTFDDLAQTTSVLGTAAYFAPEQAKGEKVDARTDIYAIGVVLYEMLTGRPPFEGDTAVAVAHQHIHAEPAPPSSINPKVSPALDVVVLKALSKAKTKRYQTTRQFATALAEAASGRVPAEKKPVSDVEQLLGPISEPAVEYTPTASELPEEFTYLFGTDPSTAPTLVQESEEPTDRKRVLAVVAIIALVSMVLTGMGLWVSTLQPASLFPSTSVTVPQLNNVLYSKAEPELKELGLIPNKMIENSGTVGKGKVIRTDPPKGTVLDPGTPITVYVSAGKTKVEVPQLADLTVEEASAQIESLGFVVGTVTESNSPSVKQGFVISTTPPLGTELLQGSTVNLLVSTGKIEIPELRGKTVTEANNLLRALLISPTVLADASCAKAESPVVRSQSVLPGVADQGTPVTITYCSG